MDVWMIFVVGVILGMVIMAIIAAAGNIQWGCRDDIKSEEQKILDQLKASELGIVCIPDDIYIEKIDDKTIYIKNGQEFYGNGYKKGYEDAKKEYARPKAKWIEKEETPASVSYYCSNCKMEGVPVTPFCPWCGAEMHEEEE